MKMKALAEGKEIKDDSVITPVSCFIPKKTDYPVLKSIVEDLEIYANETQEISKKDVTDNLTQQQRNGLESLKRNKTLVIQEADKGHAVVTLDGDYYKNKMMEELSSPVYQKLERNIDHFINLKLVAFVKKYSFLTDKEKKAITGFDFRTTNIYGKPKVHKLEEVKEILKNNNSNFLHLPRPKDLSFRIIFGGPKNPCVGLADMLNTLLNPFVAEINSVVKNSVDFINKLPKFQPDDLPHIQMWSVDVKNMYPSIEHPLGMEALNYWLSRHPKLLPSRFTADFVLKAMEFVLENNTGYFNGECYKQVVGTATGIKPAPPYANLVMGYLENILFYKLKFHFGTRLAHFFWKHYRRYLDDGQIMWDTRVGDFVDVFEIMNSLHPAIKFTHECSDKQLIYLDIIIEKTKDGFETTIYNKETDSGAYVPFTSSHPRHTKTNIPFSLARSVRALTDNNETCKTKMSELTDRLVKSGYPEGLIKTAVERYINADKSDLRKSREKVENDKILPFVHTFDPSLPQVTQEVKQLTSRLFTSKELKPIFGGMSIINSQREPFSLGRLLVHSRYDELPVAGDGPMTTKCGHPRCKCCPDMLEVNEIYFRNSNIWFKIKTKMDCTVRNLIYVIICRNCSLTYIGETVHLRSRMNTHRSCSSSFGSALAEVSRHLFECGMGFHLAPIYKMREETKVARLVKEDRLIKLLKPDLNTDTRNLLHLV